jgi:hypothetical protein
LASITASSGAIYNIITSTGILVSSTVYAGGLVVQPVYPRNINCKFYFDKDIYGVVLATAVIYGTLTVVGKDQRGNSISEVIVASNVALNHPVAGKKAFSYIDYFTVATANRLVPVTGGKNVAVADGGVCWLVGVSTAMGIMGDIDAVSDVKWSNEGGVGYNSGFNVDTTYDTFIPQVAANDSKDFTIGIETRNVPQR